MVSLLSNDYVTSLINHQEDDAEELLKAHLDLKPDEEEGRRMM